MEKNNLDNLFKEKFKDFSEIPEPRVWEKIESSLDKKKKKRVIPIWWQLGGVAALLAILLYTINPFSVSEETILPKVVDTEKISTDSSKSRESIPPNSVDKETEEDAVQVADQNIPSNKLETSQEDTPSANQENFKQKTKSSLKNVPAIAAIEQTVEKQGTEVFTSSKTEKTVPEDNNLNGVAKNGTINEQLEENEEKKLLDIKESIGDEETVVAENNEGKKSIFDAIEEQKELEKDVVAEALPKNRWSLGPSVAPVYFNSLGEGSPIHTNFASNSKSGKLNLSYGLTVSYNLSKKLSVRSGVHRVDYGYDTNDIVFSSSLTASTNALIDNITYAQTSRNLVVQNRNSSRATFDANAEVSSELAPLEGRMVQQLGYVEVPMELNYALLDSKFGVNIIGGFSSLFLVDNAVSLESADLVTEMGEANNANSVNFSTNIGVGFNYQVAPKIQLNLEPMFKYQLNTFSNTAGDFRPYSIGVYSGLNFRF